jgi:hypothetical protein
MAMNDALSEDEETPDPATARVIARVRSIMLISAATTIVAVAAVITVIGYRVFKAEGSAAMVDVTATLPKGARAVTAAVGEDRVVVTVETAAGLELHTFDLKTLKPTGRLRFATEP